MLFRFPVLLAAFSVFAAVLGILTPLPPAARAQNTVSSPASAEFGPVVLRTVVHDRSGVPLSGVRLVFEVRLDGQAQYASGSSFPVVDYVVLQAITDASGTASVRVAPPASVGLPGAKNWFRGAVRADVTPATGKQANAIRAVSTLPLRIIQSVPETSAFYADTPTLTIFDPPTRFIDGFPVWAARNGTTDKIAVVVEGFDLYNDTSATDTARLIAPALDALRAKGVSVLIVDFSNAHDAPDKLAPTVAQAVLAASRASGKKVSVAGLSMGGLVARYALSHAEATGQPLPVNTFLLLDTPNRGAIINPGLQAITMRYGTKADRDALTCDAARTLLQSVPDKIKWRAVGVAPPVLGRLVPASWTEDTHYYDDFAARLRASGGKNGYPQTCRVVAVANSSRHISPPLKGDLLTIWLPGDRWALPARPVDHAPGSLLPPYYVSRYATVYPLGVAGSYLRSAPTFVSCESALDAGPDETPPFDAWYARSDNLPPLPHNEVDAGAAAFTVREILTAKWE